jgi:hypothetical protein
MTTRKITTCYEAADGTEPTITLEVEQEDRFTAIVLDDLDDLGVPESEQAGLRARAVEAYWAAERRAYIMSNPDAE